MKFFAVFDKASNLSHWHYDVILNYFFIINRVQNLIAQLCLCLKNDRAAVVSSSVPVAEMPVGGYKQSGVGRENGLMTLQSYTRVKSIQVEMGEFVSAF